MLDLTDLLQDGSRAFGKPHGRGRGKKLAAGANEKFCTELGRELVELHADGARREVNALGCTRDRAGVHDCQE